MTTHRPWRGCWKALLFWFQTAVSLVFAAFPDCVRLRWHSCQTYGQVYHDLLSSLPSYTPPYPQASYRLVTRCLLAEMLQHAKHLYNITQFSCQLSKLLYQGSHSNDVSKISELFQHHKHQKIRPTVLPVTTFYVVLIRKHDSENVTGNIFCLFIIIINAGKLNCKNYSITDLVFQEHTSQIQDFPVLKNPNSNFRTFQGPWEPCYTHMHAPV